MTALEIENSGQVSETTAPKIENSRQVSETTALEIENSEQVSDLIELRTVWIVDSGQENPRFVTAYPL